MFTTGSNIANIKYDFINSFIQYYLLGETNKTNDEILAQVNRQLADNLSHKAIQGQLDYQVKKVYWFVLMIRNIPCQIQKRRVSKIAKNFRNTFAVFDVNTTAMLGKI